MSETPRAKRHKSKKKWSTFHAGCRTARNLLFLMSTLCVRVRTSGSARRLHTVCSREVLFAIWNALREKSNVFCPVRSYILFVLSICIVIIICGVLSPYLFNVRISASAHLALSPCAAYLGI